MVVLPVMPVIPDLLSCSGGPVSVNSCCKWLNLLLCFCYCKTLIVSVHLRTDLQTTQLSMYFTWIIEVSEGGRGDQSLLT